MHLAVTGFVSEEAGSVASANALLLRSLLARGMEVDFFSKASFVDPRPVVGDLAGFRFTDVDNRLPDRTRAALHPIPLLGQAAAVADAASYNRLLVRTIRRHHLHQPYDLCLWLGDYAAGAIAGLPTVSFAQGAPGTDARSILRRFHEIRALAGPVTAWKWRLLARLRLTKFARPRFPASDRIIVGSRQSRSVLQEVYGLPASKISILPYPIDLEMFRPLPAPAPSPALHGLWLGRIIPRKRLDLFLDAAAAAISDGVNLQLSVVGGIGFVPGYEKLLHTFPHPENLRWIPHLPREQVPTLLAAHDVLVQPSEEENFGSSVAEAQACGIPVIVGTSNGNADHLSSRDLHLSDDKVPTLAEALTEMAARKKESRLESPAESRRLAEENFALEKVANQLEQILESAIAPSPD